MITIIHVAVAVLSIAVSTFFWVAPTEMKLKLSYSFIVMTLLTGSVLVAINSANMLRTCTSGLIYTAVVATITSVARRKLALQTAER